MGVGFGRKRKSMVCMHIYLEVVVGRSKGNVCSVGS